MRRALLLAALAAPALAAAQTSGQVVNGTSKAAGELVADDQYINIDECKGLANTGIGPLELLWNVKLAGGAVNGGVFRMFATNTAPGTTEPRYCKTQDDANASPPVYAAQVGGDVAAIVGQTTESADVPTADIAQAASPDTLSCDSAQADQTITVCVHYFPSDGAGGTVANPTGWAIGQLTLSLRRPPQLTSAPTVRGGDGALEGTWAAAPSPGSGQAPATGYRVVILKETVDEVVTWKDVTTTEARVEGLENGVNYRFTVFSLSAARNLSEFGLWTMGSPVPTSDFWEYYRGAGGVEQGGCAAGAAGPLALLGVAALVAALRRRRA